MLLIVRNSGAMEFAEPSLAMEAKVNLTSSAVTSVPLWKRTPLRKWNFQVRPPSETCHFSASMGMRLPLPSRDNKFSHRGLSTTSSAPTYKWGSQRSLPKVATATVSVPTGASARPAGAAERPAGACPSAAVGAHRRAATINVRIETTRRAAIGPRMPCLPMNISLCAAILRCGYPTLGLAPSRTRSFVDARLRLLQTHLFIGRREIQQGVETHRGLLDSWTYAVQRRGLEDRSVHATLVHQPLDLVQHRLALPAVAPLPLLPAPGADGGVSSTGVG